MVRRIFIFGMLALVLIPFWLLITVSFRDGPHPIQIPADMFPVSPTFKNYIHLIKMADFPKWIMNSSIVSVCMAAGSVAVAAMAGYGFSVYRFKGSRFFQMLLVTLIAVPPVVTIVPLFVMMRVVGLSNTYIGTIVPHLLYVLGVYLFKHHIEQIPREIVESGRIDGAGEWRIFIRLMMPQCKAAAGFVALIYGITALNDYLWQLLMLRKAPTLIVGLVQAMRLLQSSSTEGGMFKGPGIMAAIGSIMFVPSLMMFIFTNRLFIQGVSLEGMR